MWLLKRGHTVWFQANFVVFIPCACFLFFVAFLFTIIWLQSIHMRYTSSILLSLMQEFMFGKGGLICVTKSTLSPLLSEIQHSLFLFDGQETIEYNGFYPFWSDALRTCTVCQLSNSVSPFVHGKFWILNTCNINYSNMKYLHAS